MVKSNLKASMPAILLVCLLAVASAPARAIDQWASIVIDFTSEYSGGGWSAAQVLGPSNTFGYGDISTSWTSSHLDGTIEHLTYGYNVPVFANGVTVRETSGNGFITRVDLIDTSGVVHTVWTGTDPSLPGAPVDNLISFPETTYPVRIVRVFVDTSHAPGEYEEIDSIQLHGPAAPGTVDQWASSVIDFSSQFSSGGNSAAQVLGHFDTDAYGDFATAWAPANVGGTVEHITVGYDTPVFASSVTIRETDGTGFVRKVELLDTANVFHTVFSGIDHSVEGAIGNFLVGFPRTPYLVKGVRVTIDTSDTLVWEEIDSIMLEGEVSLLTLNPTSVAAGKTSTGTIKLNGPAPGSGYTLFLSSSDTNVATVPGSVTVPAGKTSATFTVTAKGASAADTPVTITASAGADGDRSAVLLIQPATLMSVGLTPPTQTGGKNVVGKVTLTGPAGAGGVSVTLTNANSAATVPTLATVLAGATTGTFTITTSVVTSNTSGLVSAKLAAITKTANLTVVPPTLSAVTLTPATQTGGINVTGKVTLTGAAPAGGVVVALSNANSAAAVPANVTVLAEATTATFTMTTTPVTADTTGAVSGTVGSVTMSANLTVKPPALSKLTLNPTSVKGGAANSTATVALTGKAAAPVTVNVGSSNGSVAQPVDGSNNPITTVTVPTGQSQVTFTVKTSAVGANTSVTISANLGAVTKNTVLTVKP